MAQTSHLGRDIDAVTSPKKEPFNLASDQSGTDGDNFVMIVGVRFFLFFLLSALFYAVNKYA